MRIISNNDGIALIVTLAIITVLVTTALELNREVRSSITTAAVMRDRITLFQMASSGITAAVAMLIKDKKDSDSDSLQEDWADPEKIDTVLKDIPFENGNVSVKITDELGKIQANALIKFPGGNEPDNPQMFLWDRFLTLLTSNNESFEDIEPSEIINSMKDWIDSGDDEAITGLNGAESDYYQGLDPPYSCRNAPFTDIDELVLVKGMPKKLLYGTGQMPGIINFISIYGMTAGSDTYTYPGKININTAPLPVLAAILPVGNEDLAQAIYDFRSEMSDSKYIHDLSKPLWYKNVPGLNDVKIDPALITISSDFFRIESVATLQELKITILAVVEREKDKKTGKFKCRFLSWETG